jgi:hypothetical protein
VEIGGHGGVELDFEMEMAEERGAVGEDVGVFEGG